MNSKQKTNTNTCIIIYTNACACICNRKLYVLFDRWCRGWNSTGPRALQILIYSCLLMPVLQMHHNATPFRNGCFWKFQILFVSVLITRALCLRIYRRAPLWKLPNGGLIAAPPRSKWICKKEEVRFAVLKAPKATSGAMPSQGSLHAARWKTAALKLQAGEANSTRLPSKPRALFCGFRWTNSKSLCVIFKKSTKNGSVHASSFTCDPRLGSTAARQTARCHGRTARDGRPYAMPCCRLVRR